MADQTHGKAAVLDAGLSMDLDDSTRRAREAAEAEPVDLSVDGVLAAATARSGLDDFGPPDFRDRLGRLLGEVDRDDRMWMAGKRRFADRCIHLAALRARIVRYLDQHGAVVDAQPIVRPIIITGLSRSGTTHVENLLAADPRLRELPAYLGAEPVPAEGEELAADGRDPRWLRALAEWEERSSNPAMAAMHEHSPDHACGENELQVPDFASYEWEWRAHLPEWRDAYLAEDQTPHFAYAKRTLQAIMLQVPGPDRWLLKGNGHADQLRPLMAVYPDATIVMTHRDPVAILQSLLTMRGILAKRDEKRFDGARLAAYWVDRVEGLLRGYVRDMGLVPDAQRVDLLFHEIMADDVAAAETVLKRAGLPVTEEGRAALRAYMAAHPRGAAGKVAYNLKGDFGLDVGELYDRFAFYFDAFPVRREVRA